MKNLWRIKNVGTKTYLFDKMIETDLQSYENALIDQLDGTEPQEPLFDISDLYDALEKLPAKYKNLLLEYYFEGKTLEAMGLSRGTTKQNMFQQIKKAEQKLKKIANI